MPQIDEKAFRKHLEWLVDLLPIESAPYIDDRPRFAHAVLVFADNSQGEIIKASCIKQLDAEIVESRSLLAQITETDDINGQFSVKRNALIDSGIHENQVSSGEEADKSIESIRPIQEFSYVPVSKYVQSGHKNVSAKGNDYSQAFLIDNKSEREKTLFVDSDGVHQIPIHVKQESNYADDAQRIKTESYSYKIPQMVGTIYERPEIISRTYRSQVEETTFPSIDRYRSVRSETVRIEPRSPRTVTPLDGKTTRTTTETYTVTSIPQQSANPNEDVIAQAVQILQSSCDMLDETVDRIQRRKLLSGQSPSFNFPSENRKTAA